MSELSHVKGLSQCMAAFDDLPKSVGKGVLRRLGIQALEPMAETARRLAPDDPNTAPPEDLHGSIAVSSRQKSGRKIKRDPEGEFGVNIFMGPTKAGYPQAMPQEFGSANHPPHAFMRPAFQRHALGVLTFISENLAKLVFRAAKRWERRAARLAAKR